MVTELIKGKKVAVALEELAFLPKRAAKPIAKLVRSATANAMQKGSKEEDLCIKNITVNGASMLRRYRARAFGRGATIRHRRSHVDITLSEGSKKISEVVEAVSVEEKNTKSTKVAQK